MFFCCFFCSTLVLYDACLSSFHLLAMTRLAGCLLKHLKAEEKRKPLYRWLLCTGVSGRGLCMMSSSCSGDWEMLLP